MTGRRKRVNLPLINKSPSSSISSLFKSLSHSNNSSSTKNVFLGLLTLWHIFGLSLCIGKFFHFFFLFCVFWFHSLFRSNWSWCICFLFFFDLSVWLFCFFHYICFFDCINGEYRVSLFEYATSYIHTTNTQNDSFVLHLNVEVLLFSRLPCAFCSI